MLFTDVSIAVVIAEPAFCAVRTARKGTMVRDGTWYDILVARCLVTRKVFLQCKSDGVTCGNIAFVRSSMLLSMLPGDIDQHRQTLFEVRLT